MIQRFSLWKTAVVVVALVLGAVYGLPNGFPDDPALQVSASRSTDALGVSDLERARSALTEAGIVLVGEEFSGAQSLMRFDSVETQITAKAIVQKTLGPEFIVALNLAPTTPEWLRSIGASPMKLGLDLRGGVHFLMEVDLDAAVLQRLDTYAMQTLRRLAQIRCSKFSCLLALWPSFTSCYGGLNRSVPKSIGT